MIFSKHTLITNNFLKTIFIGLLLISIYNYVRGQEALGVRLFSSVVRYSGKGESVPLLPATYTKDSLLISDSNLVKKDYPIISKDILAVSEEDYNKESIHLMPFNSGMYEVLVREVAVSSSSAISVKNLLYLPENGGGVMTDGWLDVGAVDLKRWENTVPVKLDLKTNFLKSDWGFWVPSDRFGFTIGMDGGISYADIKASGKENSIYQRVESIKPERGYRLSFKYKNMNGDSPSFSVTQEFKNGVVEENRVNLAKEYNWQEYSLPFTTKKDIKSLKISFYSSSANELQTENVFKELKLFDINMPIMLFVKDYGQARPKSTKPELKVFNFLNFTKFYMNRDSNFGDQLFVSAEGVNRRSLGLVSLSLASWKNEASQTEDVFGHKVWGFTKPLEGWFIFYNLKDVFFIFLASILTIIWFKVSSGKDKLLGFVISWVFGLANSFKSQLSGLFDSQKEGFMKFILFELLLIVIFLSSVFYPILSPAKLMFLTFLLLVIFVRLEKYFYLASLLLFFAGYFLLFYLPFPISQTFGRFISNSKILDLQRALLYLGVAVVFIFYISVISKKKE